MAYPSLEELIRARRTGGAGEAIQSGLEGFLAGRKRRQEEDEAKLTAALNQAKLRLSQGEDERKARELEAGLISPQEQATRVIAGEATPEKVKTLMEPKKKNPLLRTGPSGEILQIDPDTLEINPLTGPKTAQLPAAEASKLEGLKTLGQLQSTLDKSFKPEFVGPVQGRAGRILPLIGKKIPAAQSKFKQNLATVKNVIINLRTGAQLSQFEAGRLLQELPDENSEDQEFQTKLRNFGDTLKQIEANRRQEFRNAGFRLPDEEMKAKPLQQAPQPQQGASGLSPDQRRARIAELRAKRDAGTLQR